MYLQDKHNGGLLQVDDSQALEALFDPNKQEISLRDQQGQNEQPPTTWSKDDLVFPSGEELPRCWKDANYRMA